MGISVIGNIFHFRVNKRNVAVKKIDFIKSLVMI